MACEYRFIWINFFCPLLVKICPLFKHIEAKIPWATQCCINRDAHTTQLSVQIAEWHVHKDLCKQNYNLWVCMAVTSLCSPWSYSLASGQRQKLRQQSQVQWPGDWEFLKGEIGLKGATLTRGLCTCHVEWYAIVHKDLCNTQTCTCWWNQVGLN